LVTIIPMIPGFFARSWADLLSYEQTEGRTPVETVFDETFMSHSAPKVVVLSDRRPNSRLGNTPWGSAQGETMTAGGNTAAYYTLIYK
jgi:hypothetical protein